MRRHRGEGTVATRLQVGLEVLASNPRVVGLLGLGLKTRGMISGARDVIRELVSRRSDFMKGSRSDVWKSVWTISPQLLSGSSVNLGALLELCNNHISIVAAPDRHLFHPKVISLG